MVLKVGGDKFASLYGEQHNLFDPHFLTSTTWVKSDYKLWISN